MTLNNAQLSCIAWHVIRQFTAQAHSKVMPTNGGWQGFNTGKPKHCLAGGLPRLVGVSMISRVSSGRCTRYSKTPGIP